VRFAALSFAAPQRVQYEVRLNDDPWQNLGSRREARYYDLPPGDYVMRVRAMSGDGVWNEAGETLAFTVEPFLWQTLGFRIIIAILLVGGGAGIAWWISHSRQRLRRQADERFRLVVEASPSALLVVDAKGDILLANPQAEVSFGYGSGEMIGKPVEMLIPPRLAANHVAFRDAYLAEPVARPMGSGRELMGRHRDGSEFPIEVGLNPIRTAEGLYVLASIMDIRERRRAEVEAQRQRNELAHLSRVNLLGEFSGSLAHELNQPLAAILSNAQAAQRFLGRSATSSRTSSTRTNAPAK
jgi:PAS domain S-box-containing protein